MYWAQAPLARTKESCSVTRQVQAHSTHLASFLQALTGNRKLASRALQAFFGRPRCRLALPVKQLSPLHALFSKTQIFQRPPGSQKLQRLGFCQENQASRFPPHSCMLPALQSSCQVLLQAPSQAEPDPCSLTPDLRPERRRVGPAPKMAAPMCRGGRPQAPLPVFLI